MGSETWEGKQKDNKSTIEFGLNPISGNSGEYLFDFGFYLEATEINKDIATKGATVFIEGNTSGTGGGIGGNGYMELGYQPPAARTLVLEKRVTGQNPDTEREFTFTVTLKNAYDGDFSGVITKDYSNGKVEQVNNPSAPFEIKLKSFESVTLRELPEGTKYDIKEKSENGYETSVTATGEFLSDNNYHVSGSLGDKVGVRVIFTNKTLTYELPETGGGSNATYIFIGGALLAAVVAGALIYKKCSKKRNGCQ